MSVSRYGNGHARRKLRKWLRDQERPCWICRAFGRAGHIDYTLKAGHPLSFEVDELVPVSLGGSPYEKSNVDAAHRVCNEWRGNKTVEQVLAIANKERRSAGKQTEGTVSRKW